MSVNLVIDESLIATLPLPLAQLYRRAHNAKSALERHQAAFYLWEAGLKLLGSACIVEYAKLGTHDPELAEELQNLARPSLGHWWGFLRRLAPVLADNNAAGFGPVRDMLLGKPRTDLPRAAGLEAALIEVFEDKRASKSSVYVAELFDKLVRYRNREFGHGAAGQRGQDFYERMGRSLLLGVSELLAKLDVLVGKQLLFIAEVRQAHGSWLVPRYELVGETARRLESLEIPKSAAAQLPDAERVYVSDSAGNLSSFHPLFVFDLEGNSCAFLNSRRGRAKTEYLCYTTGQTFTRPDLGGEQRALLAQALGLSEVSEGQAEAWAAKSQADEPATEDAPAGAIHKSLGEFELLSELGRGGMGVVYRAWQPSLGRQVALKSMSKPGDAKAEARFRREIKALGQVEHPHLVKIFTDGSYEDQIFYVMELVEGTSLADVCSALQAHTASVTEIDLPHWQQTLSTICQEARKKERVLSDSGTSSHVISRQQSRENGQGQGPIPGRLPAHGGAAYVRQIVELMRQAAEAAHVLHQHGIIHRDIKPGNILVNEAGDQATLMDLGLAQVADDEEGRLTRTRQFVGTLRYASPQQISAVSRLDARSDVYSLGATLWELLALRPLFGATEQTSTPELMEKILHDEPQRLCKLQPDLPRDLEAITHKCLEKKPEARYANAQELADDLHRWQKGEPVLARMAGPTERSLKWAKRHPLRAALLAVLVVGLVVSTSLAFWAFGERSRAKKNELLAEQRRTEAEQARDQARQRYIMALEALDQMVNSIQIKLEERADTEDLRKDILENARAGLQKLLQEAEKQGNPDSTLVWSYFRMGNVELIVGNILGAKKEYEAGHQLARRLADADASNVQAQRDLGISYERLGNIASLLGQTKDALDFHEKYFAIMQRLAQANPQNPRDQRNLSVSCNWLGNIMLQMGQTSKGLALYQKALTIAQHLAELDMSNANAQRDLSVSYTKVGDALLQLGRTKEALDLRRKAFEISQRLVNATPKNIETQRDLSIAFERLGDITRSNGQAKDALDLYQKSFEIRQSLANGNPRNTQAQLDLSAGYNQLGEIMGQLGQTKEAVAYYEKGLQISQRLAGADPKNLVFQIALCSSYHELGDAALESKQPKKALDFYQKSLHITESLSQVDAKNARAQRNHGVSCDKMGNALLELGESKDALDYYQKGLEIRRRLAEADADDARAQRDLSISFEKLGGAMLKLKQMNEAIDFYHKSLRIRLRLADVDPDNILAQRDLRISFRELAAMKRNVGQTKDAIRLFEKENVIAERLTRFDPNDVEALKDLYLSDINLGALTNSANDYLAAVNWLTKAKDIANSLQKNDSLTGDQKFWPAQVAFQLAVCQDGLRAIADIDFIFTQKPKRIPNLFDGRVQALLKRKQAADAAASVERFAAWVEKQEENRDENCYQAARLFALCAEATDSPDVLLDQAIALLNKAKDAGYFTPSRIAHIKQDGDFSGIQKNSKFAQFMSQLEAKK